MVDCNTFRYLIVLLVGFVAGNGIFFLGFLAGKIASGYSVTRAIRRDRPAEGEEVLDEEYFERATLTPEEGGLPHPTDEDLEYYNRHSNE